MGQAHDDELLVDVKGNDDKRKAMEVAEAAREKESLYPSFGKQLFMGKVDWSLIHPFPLKVNAQEKEVNDIIAKLKTLFNNDLDPNLVDETRTIPPKVIEEMAKMGIFAMKVPKEYNGLGFSQVSYNLVMQYIASYCGSTAVLVSAHQSIGVPQPLKLFGTPEQKKKFLPRFREGAISAFALTEPGVGSDPARMATKAVPTPDGKHYIINGEKLWCTNGPIADIMVVMAQTPAKIVNGKERMSITAFIVEGDSPGIEVLHRCDFMGIRGIQNGWLRFTNVKVPAENILWGEGRGLALALVTLNTGRLTLPAACAGLAKQCLSIARQWGKERVQWGAPVGEHEAGADKLAYISSMTLAIDAVTWLTSHWADRHDIDIRIEAAMAKMFCTEAGWKVADMTLQLRGGRGYERAASLKARGEKAFPVERMLRECRINTIIEGTTEIMRLFLAREAMDPHLQKAKGLLSRNTSFQEKLSAFAGLSKFYAGWYFQRWFNAAYFAQYPEIGRLGHHMRFVEVNAHRLARTMFHLMGIFAQGLEKRQLLLARIVEIGTELFAMAATCSYAHSLSIQRGDTSPIALADMFCNGARRRIKAHFSAICFNDDKQIRQLGKDVIDNKFTWIESGVHPLN